MARKGKNNNQKIRQQAAPSNALSQYGNNGNFGGGAYNNARSAGMSDDQIRGLLPGSGLKTGQGVQWVLDNAGNFPSYEGGAGAPLAGQQVGAQAYFAPNSARSRFGPNQNISLMAEPYGKSYADNLKNMNDRYWNPTEEWKQKFYDNYQDDLSGGIMPIEKTWATNYGSYKAADMPMVKGQDWWHPSYLGGGGGGGGAAGDSGSSTASTGTGGTAATTGSQLRNVGYRAAMADGKIGRKDIRAYMDEKGIKGNQQSNAQMRIADRWSSKKGARLGRGVLQDYMGNYENKNPYSSMAIQQGMNPYGVFDAKTKGKSKNDLYRAANNILTNKNYAKGDVFARLRDGTIRGETRMGGTNTKKPGATTTETQTTTTPGPVGAVDNGPMNQLQQDYADAGAMGPGGLYGGGAGGRGASRMRKARSRQQRLGIRGAGTTINNRTSPFFTALNR